MGREMSRTPSLSRGGPMRRKLWSAIFLLIFLVSFLFSQNVQSIKTIANKILANRGCRHIAVEIVKERNAISFLFTFLRVNSGIKLTEDFVACAEAVAKSIQQASWTSRAAYFKGQGKVICWIYTRECQAAMKLRSVEQQGKYIIEHLNYLPQ